MAQVLVNGVFLGCLFAVVAVGLTLIYGVMEVPNFAHSGIIALSAFATYSAGKHGAPFVVAAALGILVGGVLSVLTEQVAYRWVRDNPAAAPAVALGLLLILQNVALRIYGGEGKAVNTPYDRAILKVGNVSLAGVKVALIVLVVLALLALSLLLSRTSLGRAVRAVAQDREAAAMLGIPMQRQYTLAFLIAGLLGGVAAVAYAPTFQVSPYMADDILLSGFVVVVLGGLGSVWGAVVGGLLLGVVESLGSAYVSASYQSAFGFLALVLILVTRPTGLLTTTGRRGRVTVTQQDRSASSTRVARPRQRAAVQHAAVMAGLVVLGVVVYQLLVHLQGNRGQAFFLVAVWTVAVTGLNIVQGLGGYPSLAQAAFYGGGAYLSTIFLHNGMAMVLAALLAVLGVTVAGLVVGLVFARTRGQYFAIGTLFFGAVLTLVFNNASRWTGGPNGRPVDLGFQPTTTLRLLAASVPVGFAVFYVLRRSRLGFRLLSIREDEDLADHLGVPTARTKLLGLVLSSIFGAWAGVLLAQYNGVIAPTQFTFGQSFLMFVAVGLGGYGRLLSPLLGSLVVIGLPQLLDVGPGISQIVVGVIFIIVTLAVPGGILGGLESAYRWARGQATPRLKGARG